jgi:hypothetical protein
MAVNLNGSTQWVSNTYVDLSGTLETTIMAWLNFDAVSAGTMFDRRGSAFDFQFYYTGSFFRLFAGGLPHPITQNNFTPSVGTWYHIGFIFKNNDASNCAVYLNGVDDTSACNAKVLTSNGNAMRFGANTNGAEEFDGKMFDMRMYNRIITPAEWKIIYESKGADNITNGLEIRMLANEKPSGQTATTLLDISGKKNDGTASSSPLYLKAPLRLF